MLRNASALQIQTANAVTEIKKKIGFCVVNHTMAIQVDLHTVAKHSRSVEFSNANECDFFLSTPF